MDTESLVLNNIEWAEKDQTSMYHTLQKTAYKGVIENLTQSCITEKVLDNTIHTINLFRLTNIGSSLFILVYHPQYLKKVLDIQLNFKFKISDDDLHIMKSLCYNLKHFDKLMAEQSLNYINNYIIDIDYIKFNQ